MAGVISCLGILFCAGPARAEGEIQLRSVYYKEKATRVIQPMLDMRMDASEDIGMSAHILVDSITSASVATGAGDQQFTENRVEGGAGTEVRLGEYIIGAIARYSREPDYKSLFGGIRVTAELGQKNTLLGLGLSLGHDNMSNAGSQDSGGMLPAMPIKGELTTMMSSLSLNQVLSPRVLVGLTYDLIYLNGFQENPYRPVSGAGTQMRERVPDTRMRHAIFATARGHVPGLSSTLVASYRFYIDDWDILAHTPELRLIHQLARDVDLHLRLRHYRQSSAYFYKPIYQSLDPEVEPFASEDVKLSAFTATSYAAKIEFPLARLGLHGTAGAMRLDVLLAYVVQYNRYGNAVEGQLGVAIPLPD